MVRASFLIHGLVLASTARASPLVHRNVLVEKLIDVTSQIESLSTLVENDASTGNEPTETAPPQCSLDTKDPASWEASGGKLLLEEYLRANGSERWLDGLARAVHDNKSPSVDCSTVDTNTCGVPELADDCSNYDYFFVRWMTSRVNQAYKQYHREMVSGTIKGHLSISKLVEDFKLPEPPKDPAEDILKGLAFGTSIITSLLDFVPGASTAKKLAEGTATFMGLSGTAIGFAADNLPEPKTPDYAGFADAMEEYLLKLFTDGERRLHETLAAIFGESGNPENDKIILKDTLVRMAGMGIQDVSTESDLPVFEIFKHGNFLNVPDVVKSMEKSFDSIRHGIIANLLGSLQVYVEEREPEPKQAATGCGALGTLEENGRCFVIMRRDPTTKNVMPLEDQFLTKMGDYKLDIHTLIRSTVECNNDEVNIDPTQATQGYPRCYFGLPFAIKVAPNWHQKWDPRMNGCASEYRTPDRLPKWLIERQTPYPCGDKLPEVPKWVPCRVSSKNIPSHDEAGQARYGIEIITEGIDALGYCSWIHDLAHCPVGSVASANKQCYRDGEGVNKIRFDVSLPHGPANNDFNRCHVGLYDAFTNDNFCDKFEA
ncbi:hypothetical protein HJFPF1_05024 [Paramyrothecium foliicola]|nr:hypothetical protein HJFPF1_05024 [Paramyrothecium foliicola]